ncbi:MAG: HU family DNA-binding protein [bacterium]|nr:HU family DNA-binding protein [bacterium]
MNKAQLIETIAIKAGVSKKEAEEVLSAFEKLTIERLKEGKELTLTGFGTFSARERHARMGVNPQKPSERIEIPKVIVPKFKAGKTLKDALKK